MSLHLIETSPEHIIGTPLVVVSDDVEYMGLSASNESSVLIRVLDISMSGVELSIVPCRDGGESMESILLRMDRSALKTNKQEI